MATQGPGFFADPAEEESLESRNEIFWEALIMQVRRDGFANPPHCVLDVGCHRGGLLARIAECWAPDELIGIEPLETARRRARLRLGKSAPTVVLLDPTEWYRVPDLSVDLVVSHEVLFLLPDLDAFIRELARVVPRQGRAYIAAGCHAENPIWPKWRDRLRELGHTTYDHQPVALLHHAARHGFLPSVRPLREGGWATHDPTIGDFTFPSVSALLDHQFKHKLLFRLIRK